MIASWIAIVARTADVKATFDRHPNSMRTRPAKRLPSMTAIGVHAGIVITVKRADDIADGVACLRQRHLPLNQPGSVAEERLATIGRGHQHGGRGLREVIRQARDP